MGNPQEHKRVRTAEEKKASAEKRRKTTNENKIKIAQFLDEIGVPALRWANTNKGHSYATQSLRQVEAKKYCLMLNARSGTSGFSLVADSDNDQRYRITVKLEIGMINQYYKQKPHNAKMQANMRVLNLVNSRIDPDSIYEVAIDRYERLSVFVKAEYLPFFKNENNNTNASVPFIDMPFLRMDECKIGVDALETLHVALWDSIPYAQNGHSPLLVQTGFVWKDKTNEDQQVNESIFLYTYTFTQALFNPLNALANYKFESFQLALAEGACEGIISIAAEIKTTEGEKLIIPRDVSRLIGNFLFFQRADVSSLPLVCKEASTKGFELVNNQGLDIPQEAVNEYKAMISNALSSKRK